MPKPRPLYERMSSDGPSVYYTEDVRVMFEAHLTYLKQPGRSTLITIDPTKAQKFEYDLMGLLISEGLSRHMHWLVMRLNDMTSPTDYTNDRLTLRIPDPSIVERLKTQQTTVHKIA